jgi:hypothetical protein
VCGISREALFAFHGAPHPLEQTVDGLQQGQGFAARRPD